MYRVAIPSIVLQLVQLIIKFIVTMPLRRVNAPTQLDSYKAVLREFMAYHNGRQDNNPYADDHEFTVQELSGLKPEDIYKWMAMKAYHMEDPGPDDQPLYGRASSLEYYKKAISYFMPNRIMSWNELQHVGNPTRSADVNDLITAVKKKQVRGLGAPSKADRAFEKGEFHIKRKYMYPAMFKFQFHLIARIDDTSHVRKDSIRVCPQFPEIALNTRLRWSKNVHEERDAPYQIMLGAMDRRFCVLLALGVFMEVYIATGEGRLGNFVFCEAGCNPDTVKGHAQQVLREDALKSPEFAREIPEGKLGSHSNRKFGNTFPRRCGCSKDDTDYRGRWKGKKRMSDNYTDAIPGVAFCTNH